jgi:AraC-like DNA-binding protein
MGRVEQDGRAAMLSPGDIAFYDSTRPYTPHFDDPFRQLVVQIPKRELMLRDTRRMTARALRHGTAGGVVATFFTSLFGVAKGSPEQSGVLLPHAVGLLAAAASFAGCAEPGPDAAEALACERVLDFLRRNLADPRLDAATVAKACHVSRRTLYRMLGDEGVAARLRRMRIERAQVMLLHEPERPVALVGFACGFDSESGFHRAFRATTGITPGEYRKAWHPR